MNDMREATDHKDNWLLGALKPDDFAALESHLKCVDLSAGQVLYETGEVVRDAYFPHDAMISLMTVLEDGGTVEMCVFGREGVTGFIGTLATREALGRYIVQLPGRASRIPIGPLRDAFGTRPGIRQLF